MKNLHYCPLEEWAIKPGSLEPNRSLTLLMFDLSRISLRFVLSVNESPVVSACHSLPT